MRKKLILVTICLLTLLLAGDLVAGAATGLKIAWWTIDSGGGTSGDSRFTLSGTAGQPDAGGVMQDTRFKLSGGFWHARGASLEKVYLPIAVRP